MKLRVLRFNRGCIMTRKEMEEKIKEFFENLRKIPEKENKNK